MKPSSNSTSSSQGKKLSLSDIIGLIGLPLAFLGGIAALLAIVQFILSYNSWKQYIDTDLGFKLKYPKDWQPIKQDPTLTGDAAEFTPPKDKTSNSCPASIIVGYSEPKKIKSLEEYTNSVILPEIKTDFPDFPLPSPTLENLAQRDAHQVIYSGKLGECNWKKLDVWTLDNIKAYRITYQAEISDYPKFEKTAKEMIKTFELK